MAINNKILESNLYLVNEIGSLYIHTQININFELITGYFSRIKERDSAIEGE